MGSIISSSSISPVQDDWISSSLQPSHLVYRHTLSTCYDPIFDISFSSTKTLMLVSDDGRLRFFQMDFDQNKPLIELNPSTTKVLTHEQVQDILWSTILDRFLVLTTKRLATYDQENNLVNLDLQLEKGSSPLWRMACWSSYLLINLGLGNTIRYYQLDSSSLSYLHSWSRTSLGYQNDDLLSNLVLSPQLTLAINVELADRRHLIDLFSLVRTNELQHLRRFHSNRPCPLDVITSMRNYTWLCKSHWPSDDCLCLIESDGQVKKLPLVEQHGYVLNFRLVQNRSYVVLVRTSSKLPKELDSTEINTMEQDEEQQCKNRGRKQQTTGKLPPNLLLEIFRIPSEL